MHFSSPVELRISAVMLVTEKCCSANSCTTQHVGVVARVYLDMYSGCSQFEPQGVTIYSDRGFLRLC